jgi:ubiquitin-like modifier-activating enzyme ATG7
MTFPGFEFTRPSVRVPASFWLSLYDKLVKDWHSNTCPIGTRVSYSYDEPTDTFVVVHVNEEDSPGMSALLYMVESQEAFKQLDKNALLGSISAPLWASMCSPGASVSTLQDQGNPCVLLVYADIKQCRFVYWFGCSSFLPTVPLSSLSVNECESGVYSALTTGLDSLPAGLSLRSLGSLDGGKMKAMDISDDLPLIAAAAANTTTNNNTVTLLSWRMRNVLAYICLHEEENTKVGVFVRRSSGKGPSLMLSLDVPPQSAFARWPSVPPCIGWQLNDKGVPAARRIDLSQILDPDVLSARACSLNLQLMKWRQWPSLDLEAIKSCRVLILGAGTLGCAVARVLAGWGIQSMTLVDNGRVSYSNPSRQCLFEQTDAAAGGLFKAEAAAAALRRLAPESVMQARGVVASIPMPGHGCASDEALQGDVEQLEALISQADVVFSLLDSREARWLPTLLCAKLHKLHITAALGFDSFMVMRSSCPADDEQEPGLACYFCNDVAGVGNSTKDRTVDQQCTVSRPGNSFVCAGFAVELLVSCLNHKPSANGRPAASTAPPHIIRGSLGSFGQTLHCTRPFERCVCCSPPILTCASGTAQEQLDLIKAAVNDVDGVFLPSVSGIMDDKVALFDTSFFEDDEDGEAQ